MMTFAQQIAEWIMPILGALLLGLCSLLGNMFLRRMDSHEKSLQEIKELLADETKLLREKIHNIDRRVIWIESTCLLRHGDTPPGLKDDDNSR